MKELINLTMKPSIKHILNKSNVNYRKCVKKTRKAPGRHVIGLYLRDISQVDEFRDLRKLQQHIENDPIIRDQIGNLGCLLMCTFGNFVAPVLVAAHTVNNLDLGD